MFCSECGHEVAAGGRYCPSCGAEVGEVGSGGTAAPASSQRRSRPRLQVVAPLLLGGIALVAVLALLIGGLGGSGSGASSPEAAVRQLATALERDDLAAAFAVVDPDEAGTLADLYESVDRDFGGSENAASGEGAAGVEVEGLRLSEEQMGPGVAKVAISGGSAHGSFGSGLLVDLFDSEADVDVDFGSTYGPAGESVYVMTREVDGRWYVSPTMTLLGYLVDEEALAEPDFSSGAGSPGSAKRLANGSKLMAALAEAINSRDVNQLLGLFSKGEVSGIRPYVAALQGLVGEIEGSAEIQVADSDFSEHDLGSGLVRLDLEHASLDAYISDGYEGGQASVKLNGFCVNVLTSSGYSSDSCDTQVRRLFGVDNFFVVARREDDGMRLAPVATLAEYARLFVERLGSDGVRRFAGTVEADDGGDLSSVHSASGKLSDAGYAALPYTASGPGLVAIEADQYVTLLDPNGERIDPLGCPGGVQVYALDAAGAYEVVVASGEYETGSYTITAEPVQPRSTGLANRVNGTLGDGVPLAAYSLEFSGSLEELTFETSSPVYAQIAESGLESRYCAGYDQGTTEQVVGPESLFSPLPAFEAFPPPSAGDGYAYEIFIDGSSDPYLFIAGQPGTGFSGEFEVNAY